MPRHITEETASDLAEGFGGQMLHGIHTYQHLSKGCRLNPKDGVLGTPNIIHSAPLIEDGATLDWM